MEAILDPEAQEEDKAAKSTEETEDKPKEDEEGEEEKKLDRDNLGGEDEEDIT